MLPTGCSGDGSVTAEGIREDKVTFTHYLHTEWAEAMLEQSHSRPGGLPQYQEQMYVHADSSACQTAPIVQTRPTYRTLDLGRYPMSLWRLGSGMTWVALGGEVTVGYVNRLRAELAQSDAWISAYTNQVRNKTWHAQSIDTHSIAVYIRLIRLRRSDCIERIQ